MESDHMISNQFRAALKTCKCNLWNMLALGLKPITLEPGLRPIYIYENPKYNMYSVKCSIHLLYFETF